MVSPRTLSSLLEGLRALAPPCASWPPRIPPTLPTCNSGALTLGGRHFPAHRRATPSPALLRAADRRLDATRRRRIRPNRVCSTSRVVTLGGRYSCRGENTGADRRE